MFIAYNHLLITRNRGRCLWHIYCNVLAAVIAGRRYLRLNSLAVAEHVNIKVERVIQHLYAKEVIFKVAPHLCKLQQFLWIKYGPIKETHIRMLSALSDTMFFE